MNKCLRRLVLGSRRVVGNIKTNNRYVCDYNSSIIQTTDNSFKSLSWFGHHDVHPGGYAYRFVPKNIDVGRDVDVLASKEMHTIEQGHIVNLSQLIFTKKRDYLVRYNDPHRVVVLYFLDRNPYSISESTAIASLIDMYNDSKDKNCFEVVFVYVADILGQGDDKIDEIPSSYTFENVFSCMPWTAIPFSDYISRKYLTLRFKPSKDTIWRGERIIPVDSTGLVLSKSTNHDIRFYGSWAFPFTKKRIATIKSEIYAASKQPSLKTLLATPERDYVVSNKGEQIPIQTLEDKVVALLLYEDGMEKYYPIEELKQAYEELRKNNENFEVVLVYLTDTLATYKHTNKETYQETFKTMPWLALPFKDPILKKLELLFNYPPDSPSIFQFASRIVIVGPHADYIEPCGAEILSNFGVASYPFTRENLVRLDTEKAMELKLEMLCSPATVFKRKDGFEVQFSQLLGKRVILCLENSYDCSMKNFLIKELNERYLRTDDEFEMIYIPFAANDTLCLNELLRNVSCLVSSPYDSGILRSAFAAFTGHGKFHLKENLPLLLAFGEDGKLVRRSFLPWVQQEEFPFYAGSMEMEAFECLSEFLFDASYTGLERNPYEEEENSYFESYFKKRI